jgi:hypothetical protein
MRFRLALALAAPIVVVACGRPLQKQPAAVAPPAPATITVGIVVDQLAAWIADERLGELPDSGGFARLRREGAYARDVRYAHAVTDTAPGHAALYTGKVPRESGIYANEVFEGDAGPVRAIVFDATKNLVGEGGPTLAPGASLARLDVPTLADTLRSVRPDADIVAISVKDRGALFGGGRAPNASLWFDSKSDAFVTSTAFAQALPTWAREHASHASLEALRAPAWTLLDPGWVSSHARTADAQLGEGDDNGYGTTFPHLVSDSKKPGAAFRTSPYADLAVVRLAIDAIAAHDPKKPMLLALSLSANDTIGHLFGPDSWEAWDNLRRLDVALAALFAALDAKVGAERWSVALTGDHGASTLPEAADVARPWCGSSAPDLWERPCGPLGRLVGDVLADSVEAEVRKALGKAAPPGRIVRGIIDPYLYFTHEVLALPEAERASVEAAVRAALLATAGVAGVAAYAPAECPPSRSESIDALVCRSTSAKTAGALYIVTKPGYFFDAGYVVGKGSSHGAPYLYTRSVPLLVRSPHRVVPAAVDRAPRPFTAFTSSLAAMLRLRFTSPPEDSLVH